MNQGVDQATSSPLRSAKSRLQPVAERHEFIYLLNDAVLLGEGREWKWMSAYG